MNAITDKLTSLSLERQFLGGLFNHHKNVLYDVDLFLKESDFSNVQNQTIYTILKNIILEGNEPNKVIVAQTVKDLRISFKDEISPFDYIESLTHTQITAKTTIETAKQIVKFRVRRSIYQDSGEVQTFISGPKCAEMTIAEIVNETDRITNKTISQINEEDEPVDIFENIENIIKNIAANPTNEVGMITPFAIFNQFFGGLRHGNGLYNIISRSGEGKALEENTLIPTPNGFSKIKDLNIGDEVFAIDGSITKITNKASWTNRKIYKVTTDDGHEILADEKHEWKVKQRSNYNWQIIETKEILNKSQKSQRRCTLPLHSAIQLPERELPLDPYILGLWLGDGYSRSPALTSNDEPIIKIWKEFAKLNECNVKKMGKYGYLISNEWKGNPLLQKLQQLDLIENKHIPQIYFRTSINQRKLLLQGLIDSNGYVNPAKGETEFCNKNKLLAEGVLELVHSLGIKARICKNKSFLYEKRCADRYRVKFYYNESALLPRKRQFCKNGKRTPFRYIEVKEHGYGNTVCIEIAHPSHLFLCGKAMIPTHNSCFLFNMAKGVSLLNNIPTLYLDTEMDKEMNMFRAVAAETGINSWFLETGKWIKNAEMAQKVLDAFPKLKKYEGRVYHKTVPNKDIREILAIIRKWYFKHVGRGNKALIVYDYLKITSDIDKNRQEWQQLGDKVSYLNEIGAKLGCPIWSAGQQNRSAEFQGQRNDDSTTAGASDRINQYVCFNGTFRAKTLEELEEQGPNFGTHLLKPFKTSRTSGENSYINNRLVRVRDPGTGKYKYKQNFINYNIHEYNITESGTYRDVITHLNLDAQLQPETPDAVIPF